MTEGHCPDQSGEISFYVLRIMMWRQYVNIWSEDVLCPVCSAKHRHFWTQWSKHSLFLQNSRETTACRLRGDCSSENILFIFPSPQYNVHPLCPLSRANSFNLQNRTVRSVTERREERDQRHCIAWSLQCGHNACQRKTDWHRPGESDKRCDVFCWHCRDCLQYSV